MAIAPIDLQTLFTQVDKVGKTYGSQRDGHALHQAIQNVQIQKKIEEQIQQVNEAQNSGEGAEKVNDHGGRQNNARQNKKRQKENDDEEEPKASVINAPGLGKIIDISL